MPEPEPRNIVEKFFKCMGEIVEAPGTFIKGIQDELTIRSYITLYVTCRKGQ